MADETNVPQRESIRDIVGKYKESQAHADEFAKLTGAIPSPNKPTPVFNAAAELDNPMNRETDPDLMTSYEIVQLPSRGMFYPSRIDRVDVEYMTSKDEDLLTTPSLIESGNVINILLKRKIKTRGVIVEDLLEGDRNAIILYLRTSSYGSDYTVQVADPRTGIPFKTTIDLLQLKYKEPVEMPDESGHFSVKLPMRKKTVVFRLLTSGEDNLLFKKAEALKDAFNLEFTEYSTMKIKSHIISIDGNTDRSYIDRFVDAMPALDSYTIRRKIQTVSPDVDMSYEFMAKDGYKFLATLSVGTDFFFPNT
jgi:hypothetical protein